MRPKITYRNTDIAYKSDTKFLGIHITENLKWITHIRTLRLQLSKVRYVIKSVQGIMGMISFYHSKFESLVRYGVIFCWADNESVPIFTIFTKDYGTHLRNMGTLNILCDDIRLFCYWITSPHQWTTAALHYANVDVLPEFSAD